MFRFGAWNLWVLGFEFLGLGLDSNPNTKATFFLVKTSVTFKWFVINVQPLYIYQKGIHLLSTHNSWTSCHRTTLNEYSGRKNFHPFGTCFYLWSLMYDSEVMCWKKWIPSTWGLKKKIYDTELFSKKCETKDTIPPKTKFVFNGNRPYHHHPNFFFLILKLFIRLD